MLEDHTVLPAIHMFIQQWIEQTAPPQTEVKNI